jgi:hypothetical protein
MSNEMLPDEIVRDVSYLRQKAASDTDLAFAETAAEKIEVLAGLVARALEHSERFGDVTASEMTWRAEVKGALGMAGGLRAEHASADGTQAKKREHGLLLLRMERGNDEPLYIVVEHSRMWDDEDVWDYFVNEGTCPTNLLRCEALIDGEDTDPHGILEFVQWMPRPPEMDVFPRMEDRTFWRNIFSRLPEAANAE